MGCALGSADIRAIAIAIATALAGWCDGAVSTILTAADSVGEGRERWM